MTAHDDFFRQAKPAAVFKHSLLAEYCNVFVSMLGQQGPGPIWFIDGYAGPGQYEAGRDGDAQLGSPLVAMHLAVNWMSRGSRDLRCVFIEADPGNAAKLRERVSPFVKQGLVAHVYGGSVQGKLRLAWAHVQDAAVLTFLDPFGVAMKRDLLLDPLLNRSRGARPSEVLLNINVEAVWRIGGNLEQRDGHVVPVDGQERTIRRVDDFLGGPWWREQFYEARVGEGSAARAAASVIDAYRKRVESDASCMSVSVPIRRRPGNPTLFLLTLFYRDPVAAYKFADAASRASRQWRNTYRARELADSHGGEEGLFGPEVLQAFSDADAKAQEDRLRKEWVQIIKQNMRRLLDEHKTVSLKRHVLDILGNAVSLAGEKEIRVAWDELADDGVAKPRDKSLRMYKLSLVSTRS